MTRITLVASLLVTVSFFDLNRAAAQNASPPGATTSAVRSNLPTHPLMQLFDTDHDGVLSSLEIDKAVAVLKSLDKDHNGNVTLDEIRQQLREGEDSLNNPPLAKDDAERKSLAVFDDISGREMYQNTPPKDCRLLRLLTEAIGAKTVVEIGTSTGHSGIWFCLGLRPQSGRLITFDIDPQRIAIARENFQRAGVADMVTIVAGDAHENVKQLKDPVDLVFIDADKAGYLDYLNKLLPLVRPGGLIVSHNMSRPAPDPKFLEAITANPALETMFFHMDVWGVGVSLKKH